VICMTCKVDRAIDLFDPGSPGKRPKRRCRICHDASAERQARWRQRGRQCSRCQIVKACPREITDFDREPAVCKTCQKTKERDRQREWTRAKRAADDDFRRRQIEATIRWQKRHPDYVLAAEHARYARMRADEERYARHKEDARMRYRLRQEREGVTLRVLSEEAYHRRYGDGQHGSDVSRLDAAPLRRLLRADPELDMAIIAERSGLSRSYVERVTGGKYTRLALRDADRLCIALGTTLSALYPLEAEAA
jgi:transcriptional regulator with XRE-family HTH domain